MRPRNTQDPISIAAALSTLNIDDGREQMLLDICPVCLCVCLHDHTLQQQQPSSALQSRTLRVIRVRVNGKEEENVVQHASRL